MVDDSLPPSRYKRVLKRERKALACNIDTWGYLVPLYCSV